MSKPLDMQQITQSYKAFLQRKKTCVLSFVDGEGKPFSSTTPFVYLNGKFYVYMSRIAEHYPLMKQSTAVEVLCVADEAATANPFAIERARWQCQPQYLGNTGYEEIFVAFDQKFHANLMVILRSLDFSLFELTPLKGRYIIGFGKAFTIDPITDTLTHIVIDKK